MRIRYRTLSIILLVFSSLWMLGAYVPLVYGLFSGPQDLQAIVHALENRGVAPPLAVAAVQETIVAAGPLQRAIQIGYFRGASITVKLNERHTENRVQTTYIAWFQRLQKPVLLILERKKTDNAAETYEIAEGEPMSMVRALALPCIALVLSIIAFRMSKPKVQASVVRP
jgi:hypothetical protein